MTLNTGNLFFIVELLLAELIFLYPVPRRSLFWLRFPLIAAAVIALAGVIPSYLIPNLREVNNLVRFFGLFAISTAGMSVCFRLPAETLVSMCVAGYAVQHFSYRVSALTAMLPVLPDIGQGVFTRGRIFEVVVMILMYIIVWLTLGRFCQKNECYKNRDRRFTRLSVVIILICVGLSRVAGLFGEDRGSVSNSLYSIVCCWLALYIQFNLHLQSIHAREQAAMETIHREEARQYEITRNLMASINVKVHDFRHRLLSYGGKLAAEEIEGLREDMDIYDTRMNTGNEVLDVLLMDKMITCRFRGIRISISGNWAPLSFIRTMDLYSFFGNALDNAIEAAEKLTEEDKKIIDLSVENRGDMYLVTCTNYFIGQLVLEDGLPRTIKESEIGYHGYGMKSMKLIAEKYGGALSVSTQDDRFILSAYFFPQDHPT